MLRALALVVLLSASLSLAAGRTLTVTTTDGRQLSGEVVMEAERGLLLRTADGNVMVPWADIASSRQEGAPQPVAAPQKAPSRQVLSLGLSVGLGGSPIAIPGMTNVGAWYALDASLFMHFDFNKVGLRLAVPLQIGPWTRSSMGFFRMFSGLEAQLRFQFSPAVSSAIGVQAGLGLASGAGGIYSQVATFFAFGPTLTPIALRLGDTRQHELSLQASLQLATGNNTVGYAASLVSVKYAYVF